MAEVPKNGWRRVCWINTTICIVATVLATILLIYAAKSGIRNGNMIFYKGSCHSAKSINLWLHLLLNVFSTGVVASSSFFMQILSSPTRSEVNRAHRKNISLSIGIPNIDNLRYVSTHKSVLRILFAITSLPFHFFFNSVIFFSNHLGANWNLLIAAEGFANGAAYFEPGAVMLAEGSTAGYGKARNISDYFDSGTAISKSIHNAASNGRKWKRLEVPECLSRYGYCSGRDALGDVIWVVCSHDSSMALGDPALGWNTSELLEMSSLSKEHQNTLRAHIPYDTANSLWFAAECLSSSTFGSASLGDDCSQSCTFATGIYDYHIRAASSIDESYSYDFFRTRANGPQFQDAATYGGLFWPGIRDKNTGQLDLQYCLAEELAGSCKVGLSNTLFSVVVVCLGIKTVLCLWTLFVLSGKEPPLVVVGDAVASFISSPDSHTIGQCTLDRTLAEKLCQADNTTETSARQPWRTQQKTWRSTIPGSMWGSVYLFFLVEIGFIALLFAIAQQLHPLRMKSKQDPLDPLGNPIFTTSLGNLSRRLIPAMLTANIPQLLLTLHYFLYNAIFTHLCVEKEWKSYSLKSKTLRVTYPAGQQRSTYRLQLPYRYSIALIIASIALHWVVSNVFYVFVYEGGYISPAVLQGFNTPDPFKLPPQTGLDKDYFFAIGYSTLMLFVLLVMLAVLTPIPLALASRKAHGHIPDGGSNSLVISAACHVHVSCTAAELRVEEENLRLTATESDGMIPMVELGHGQHRMQAASDAGREQDAVASGRYADDVDDSNEEGLLDSDAKTRYLMEVTRGLLRWGVVAIDRVAGAEDEASCGHLSFGTAANYIEEPIEGKCYI